MYMLLWIFFVYAFLGWCTEVSFAALTSGKFGAVDKVPLAPEI